MYKREKAKKDYNSKKKWKKSEILILAQCYSFKINIVKNTILKTNLKKKTETNDNFDPRSMILIQIWHGDRRRLDWKFNEQNQ